MTEEIRKIGPSILVTFDECMYHYYLTYVKKLSVFKQTVDTAFGNAAHDAIQYSFKKRSLVQAEKIFFDHFNNHLFGLGGENKIQELMNDARNIFDNIDNINKEISLQEISDVVCEEEIKQKINDNWLFSGRLDLVFNYKKKWRIIDIKTAKATWTFDKLQNIAVISQPLLYKYFWAKKHNVTDLTKITTHYMFLNKKAKGESAVKIIKIPSGPETMKKALDNLENTMKLIEKKKFYKNYSGCRFCEFKMTKECPLDALQRN